MTPQDEVVQVATPVRGSRRHVLDWAGQPEFAIQLTELARPVEFTLTEQSSWMPRGWKEPREARLESFGPGALSDLDVWPVLRRWWLAHERGANTPNWDIALSGSIGGRPGLILVEAKANGPELSKNGKPLDKKVSQKSRENHGRIGEAILEAAKAIRLHHSGIKISRDSHYQLSNRLAFAWKLASLGVPTILMYLGFIGDTGIRGAFTDEASWNATFRTHLEQVCSPSILDAPFDTPAAPFWVLCRSRPVMSMSPPAR